MFKDQNEDTVLRVRDPRRIGIPKGYRTPFTHYAVTRDVFSVMTLYPNYHYRIHRDIPLVAADLFRLIDKPHADDRGGYMQLLVLAEGVMRAKIRTDKRTYVFMYCTDSAAWAEKQLDHSKPCNW